MPVLSHRQNETLLVGSDVEVTILEINSNQVRIGMSAPANVPIVRSELIDSLEERTYPKPRKRFELINQSLASLIEKA
jgi:carbon storage regulator